MKSNLIAGFCILLLFKLSKESFANVWNAEDALILEVDGIDQSPQNSSSSEEVVTTTEIPVEVEAGDGDCYTKEGIQGVCTKFTECYPYFKEEIKDIQHSIVASHIQVVKNLSTSCQPEDSTTNNPQSPSLSPGGEGLIVNDDYICCATLSRAVGTNLPEFPNFLLPVKKPTKNEKQNGTTTTTAKPSVSEDCGVTPYVNDGKVVHGREAKIGEFPFSVAMFYNNRQHCGGSLIDSRHVITAAHCVNSLRTSSMLQQVKLYIGAHDIYGAKDFEVRKVKRMAFHKGFGNLFRDDIALLVLDSPVSFTSRIKPICLYSGDPPYDGGETNADVAGWGKISEHGPPSRKLRTATIRIWTNAQCAQKYAGTQAPAIYSGMVCAGTNGKDSCQGDSGGPLSISKNGKQYLVGVVSWGIKCGVYPGVYTRVDKYLNWVEKYKVKLNY